MPSVLALITVMILVGQAAAGTWTEHQFIYKPSLGARGEIQKNAFDSGMDRVDAHLGRHKTLGDPGYETLAEALATIGGTATTLMIPHGTTVSITGNTSIPANVHLMMLNGGKFDIADGITLTINGPFDAGLYQVFSWTGSGKVVFGTGAVARAFPEWWGAKPDGVTECATSFQRAFDAWPVVKLGKGTYKLTNTSILLNSTTVAMGYTLKGEGMETVIKLYGYTDKYALHLNADANKNRVVEWPQNPRLQVEDLKVENGDSNNANFLYVQQSSVLARNVRLNYLYKGFYFAGYCDRITLQDIHWQQPKDNGQFFYLRQGDALTIDGLSFFPHGVPGCHVTYSGGFRISNVIGGIHKFEYCQGGVFENSHLEGQAELLIGHSSMVVRNNFFYNRNKANNYVVLCDNLGSYWNRHVHVTFEDNVFSFVPEAAGDVRSDYDIKLENPSSRDVYTFRNNVGNLCGSSSDFVGEKVGIMVGSSNPGLGALLEAHKGSMARTVTIAQENGNWRLVEPGVREVWYSGAPDFFWQGESGKPSNLPQGTYYYRPAWYNEVGHTTPGPERSVTTTAPNKSAELTINAKKPYGVLRIWRGTSSGSYDRYVDIPLAGNNVDLHDMGDTLNGHAWITSGVPGVPTANTTMDGIITSAGKRQFWASAAPTSAEFTAVRGDVVFNTTPSAGGPPGWVCVTAGSPGTWKAMANLAN